MSSSLKKMACAWVQSSRVPPCGRSLAPCGHLAARCAGCRPSQAGAPVVTGPARVACTTARPDSLPACAIPLRVRADMGGLAAGCACTSDASTLSNLLRWVILVPIAHSLTHQIAIGGVRSNRPLIRRNAICSSCTSSFSGSPAPCTPSSLSCR